MHSHPDHRLSLVYERVKQFIDAGEIDGAALAVARGREVIAEWCLGEASAGTPAAATTLWPLACMTKPYTAATILALVERGALTLATPVHALLPRFSGGGREAVRVRHLLTHTAGLPRPEPTRVEEQLRRKASLAEILADAYELPLLFPPGTAFNYSDHGYGVLGQLAEAATGSTFAALVDRLVLEPAGLHQTFAVPPARVYDRIATVRGVLAEGTDGEAFNSTYARQLGHPGCCAVATIGDVLRFGRLFGPEPPATILSGASVRLMTTDQTGGQAVGRVLPLYPPQRQPWGCGFAVRGQLGNGADDMASPEAFHHAGAAGSLVLVDPSAGVTIAFASNRYIATGFEEFVGRLTTVVNMVLAALT
jgi:CubicO group peptidase (beta-lactamase class C family)